MPSVVIPPLGGSSSSSESPGAGSRVLPADFPLPPGAGVAGGTDDGSEIVARLSLADGASAVAFWRQALPAAGYRVASVEGAAGFTEIRLSGRGFSSDDSQIVVTGSTAAVQLTRG